ncbi:hypothetical protein Q3G72_010682 [Acer saccharum]|nr:hypothetical protein Q3G72_010682 [Acer saccharum]
MGYRTTVRTSLGETPFSLTNRTGAVILAKTSYIYSRIKLYDPDHNVGMLLLNLAELEEARDRSQHKGDPKASPFKVAILSGPAPSNRAKGRPQGKPNQDCPKVTIALGSKIIQQGDLNKIAPRSPFSLDFGLSKEFTPMALTKVDQSRLAYRAPLSVLMFLINSYIYSEREDRPRRMPLASPLASPHLVNGGCDRRLGRRMEPLRPPITTVVCVQKVLE